MPLPHWFSHLTWPPVVHRGSTFSTSSLTPVVSAHDDSHPNGYEVLSGCSFDSHFSSDRDIAGLCLGLSAICEGSLEKCLFKSFTQNMSKKHFTEQSLDGNREPRCTGWVWMHLPVAALCLPQVTTPLHRGCCCSGRFMSLGSSVAGDKSPQHSVLGSCSSSALRRTINVGLAFSLSVEHTCF